MKIKLRSWKVGGTRTRKAKGRAVGYSFHCFCGNFTVIGENDKIRIEKAVNGYIPHGKCSGCKEWVVLEHM